MTKQKHIIIEIDNDGNCSVDGEGFVGPECDRFMKEIEESLGTTSSTKQKPEYRQRSVLKNRRLERN